MLAATSPAYAEPPFSTVSGGLSQIAESDPAELSADAIRDDIRWFAVQIGALEALSARWLAELDRRMQGDDRGPFDTCSWFLQESLHLSSNAAYARIRTARQLASMPRTVAALRRGELSSQQLAVICRAVEQAAQTTLEPSRVESELIEAARRMDHLELERHWFQMRYQADQEAGLAAEQEQRRRRWLYLRQTRDGSFRMEAQLDAETGVTFKTALHALMGPRASHDDRTPAERRADAAGEMAGRVLDAGDLPEQGGERPHVLLKADLATLRLEPGSPLAELDWGQLVTGETARRIACDAQLTPVLTDSRGNVLHVGRSRRFPTVRQRKALNLRDLHCQAPGCTVPAERCEAHHIRHVADGGRTVLPNLRLYCRVHHPMCHPENRRFRRQAVQSRAP